MNFKKIIKMLVAVAIFAITNVATPVRAVEGREIIMSEFENRKIAYLTFDDGPSIYTEQLLNVLNQYDVPGIFFVLGSQINFMPDVDQLLTRMVNEGHFLALHTMTHDKNALYRLEKSPQQFTNEMLELRADLKARVGWETNLCRAPYGKANHFRAAHHKAVAEAGLYCVDWHIDSWDWAKQNADQIYQQIADQLKDYRDSNEIVLLFHEYKRTVDVLPQIIELLKAEGFTFEPYVEGHVFDGLE